MIYASNSIRRCHPIVFSILAVISVIVAGIASRLTSDFNFHQNAPSATINGSVRFLVFTGWWSALLSIAYTVLFLTGAGKVFISIAGHGLWLLSTWLFFLAGAGALTVAVGSAESCSTSALTHKNDLLALIAFTWIGWIILTLLLGTIIGIGGAALQDETSLKEGLCE